MIVAFLDLPAGTTLTLDGSPVQLSPNPPSMVGFRSIPHRYMHFITIRCQSHHNNNHGVVHGFFLASSDSSWVRRYDPFKEEVASHPVDDLTQANALAAIAEQTGHHTQLDNAVPSYHTVVVDQKLQQWTSLTGYISNDLLEMRRLLNSNEATPTTVKIVPGVAPADDHKEQSQDPTAAPQPSNNTEDATACAVYPPIPVLFRQSHRHAGTRAWLQRLPPAERTAVFTTSSSPTTVAMDWLLTHEYRGDYTLLLGDLQLSFLLFTQLQCYPSLTHWRDLTALLGQIDCTHDDDEHTAQVLAAQVNVMEDSFLDEYQDSAVVQALTKMGRRHMGLRQALQKKGLVDIASPAATVAGGVEDMLDAISDDDEDGPVVVENVAISSQTPPPALFRESALYPLLAAAIRDHEDVLMTCARVLDDAVDVSLVREAAAYLEQVEATRMDE